MNFHILDALLSGDFSSLWPPLVGSLLTGAYDALKDMWNDIKNQFDPIKQLKDYIKGYWDDIAPSQAERIRKDVENLYNEVKQFGSDVVQNIANAVNQGLDTGELSPTAPDGSLGQAHDIYTPDGQVPMNFGTLPGIDIPSAGMNRDAPGGGGGGGGYSGSSSGGGTTPLNQGGSSGGSTGGGGTQPPTANDLGVEPGSYIEYQPGEGQVVITHPDGSVETRPWPPN